MKKLCALATLLLPISLMAGQYVGLSIGPDYAHQTDDSKGQKVGYKIGASYGYKWANGVRGEFDLGYRDGHKRTIYSYTDVGPDKKTHTSTHSISYMANICYDIGGLQSYGLTPYVGGGIGYCSSKYENKTQVGGVVTNRDKGTDDRFAWQLIAGAKYPIADQLELAAEYKYFNGSYHAKNHSFSAALIRSF